MKPIIKVNHLSKKYRYGEEQSYYTLRDTLTGFFQRKPKEKKLTKDEFWALKNVSFEVNPGETVGIIGRNGAGKSTILKILSRITPPTKGDAILRGRVGSLLEVGTGFHPELTGRENIYLNGAILGMTRREINRKFDEIVNFAEVEKFLDTPVKHYSSGMYMRLAFAVAAHLESEILIIDEVLAVGDVQFQKKCLGKVQQASKEDGRTVLFVSHNMGVIQSLCQKTIYLSKGEIVTFGDTQEVVSRYIREANLNLTSEWKSDRKSRSKYPLVTPRRLALVDNNGRVINIVTRRDSNVYLEIEFFTENTLKELNIGIGVYNQYGINVFRSLDTDTEPATWPKIVKGLNKIKTKLPLEIMNEGDYKIALDINIHKTQWIVNPDLQEICVDLSVQGGLSKSPYWLHARQGVIAPVLEWYNSG